MSEKQISKSAVVLPFSTPKKNCFAHHSRAAGVPDRHLWKYINSASGVPNTGDSLNGNLPNRTEKQN